MLEKLIQEKAHQISYNAIDLENISRTSARLQQLIDGNSNFRQVFPGGAFLRHTLVKNVCELELYFEYGHPLDSPADALCCLISCLNHQHLHIIGNTESPFLRCKIEGIHLQLIPFIRDTLGNTKVPAEEVSGWKIIYSRPLEEKIRRLVAIHPGFLQLIRLIKYWNHRHRTSIAGHRIEEIIYSIFAHEASPSSSFSDWLWTFFNQAPCYLSMYDFKAFPLFQDALGKLNYSRDKIHQLMTGKKDKDALEKSWNIFIENQAVGERVE